MRRKLVFLLLFLSRICSPGKCVALSPGEPVGLAEGTSPMPETRKAVHIVMHPLELAEGAALVWWEDGAIQWAEAKDGAVWGPPPDALAGPVVVVGPRCRARILQAERGELKRDELDAELEPGWSHALVCESPWGGEVTGACRINVGVVPGFLRGKLPFMAWSLKPLTSLVTKAMGGFVVLEGSLAPEARAYLRAEAPDLPPVLLPFPVSPGPVSICRFPTPFELSVRLEDEDGLAIGGRVTVAKEVDGHLVALVERQIEATREATITLSRGEYRLIGEAAGRQAVIEEVTLREGRKRVTLSLGQGKLAKGRVLESQGAPVEGATVLALSRSKGIESQGNVTQTDDEGRFTVTLPAEGPWLLRVEKPGYALGAVELSRPEKNVTVILKPTCLASLLLLGPNGKPVDDPLVVALQAGSFSAVPGSTQDEGNYQFALSPGPWTLYAEQSALMGQVDIPPACQELRQVITLRPKIAPQ